MTRPINSCWVGRPVRRASACSRAATSSSSVRVVRTSRCYYAEIMMSRLGLDSQACSVRLETRMDMPSGAYETASSMASLPFTTRMLAQLAILVLLPFAPLTLTLIPLDKMVDSLIKLIL